MLGLFRKGATPKDFWAWFAGAADRLAQDYDAYVAGEGDVLALIAPVDEQLKRYHKGLAHEIGAQPDGRYDLVISANGLRENIEPVQRLVESAPSFQDWHVTAFRQPRPIVDSLLVYGDRDFQRDDIRYLMRRNGDEVDVALAFDRVRPEDEEGLRGPGFLLLDRLIGEYAVMTRVGAVQTVALERVVDPARMKPITGLRAEFEGLFPNTPH